MRRCEYQGSRDLGCGFYCNTEYVDKEVENVSAPNVAEDVKWLRLQAQPSGTTSQAK